jgi:hypothetical protein
LNRAISALLLVASFLMVGLLLLFRPGAKRPGLPTESIFVYVLEPGSHVDLVVPPDVDRVRISSRIAAPAEAVSQPGWGTDYTLRLMWLDLERRVVREKDVVERTRISRFPSDQPEPHRNSWLRDDPRIVTDGRATVVPAGAILSGGGTLRIGSPPEGRTLFVRAWGETPRDPVAREQMRHRPTAEQQDEFTRHVGLPDWTELTWGERSAIARNAWRTLKPAEADSRTAWLQFTDFQIIFHHQLLSGYVIEPHRKLAINFDGPVGLDVAGPPGTNGLVWSTVADHPSGEDPATVTVRRVEPLPLYGLTEARRFQFPGGTAVSLTLFNDSDRPVGPIVMTLPTAQPSDFFGWTIGAVADDLLPREAPVLPDGIFVAPEWRFHRIYRTWANAVPIEVEATQDPTEMVALEIRSILLGHDDVRPRSVTVSSVLRDGSTGWIESGEIPTVPAPYEYRLPTLDEHLLAPGGRAVSWISEPYTIYIPDGENLDTLRITTDDDLLVIPRLRGPEQGGSIYELPWGDEVDVRYEWRALRDWHRVEARNMVELLGAGQLAQVAFDVRLEPRDQPQPGEDTGPVDRSYTSIHPSDPRTLATARVWLQPIGQDAQPGPVVCRVQANAEATPFGWDDGAAAQLQRNLDAWVWSPDSSALGRTWRLEMDGQRWRSGAFAQRAVRTSSNREANHATARLLSVPGALAWLRTYGPPSACAEPHRPVVYYPLSPGESATFPLAKHADDQVLSIGALGSPTDIDVTLDGGTVRRRSTGILTRFTKERRTLSLPKGDGDSVVAIDDPDLELPRLRSRGLWLGDDLAPGGHRATLTNVGGSLIWVRAALEDAAPSEAMGRNPVLVRDREAP